MDLNEIAKMFGKEPYYIRGKIDPKERVIAFVIKVAALPAIFIGLMPRMMPFHMELGFSVVSFAGAVFSAIDLFVRRKCYIEDKLPYILGTISALGFSTVIFMKRDVITDRFNDGGLRRIFFVFFIIGGVLAAVNTLAEDSIRKRRCTVPVTATCTGSALYSGGRNRTYVYIWEFFFEGETIRTSDKMPQMYYMMETIPTGQVAEIMVNPDDPTDIYRRSPGRLKKKLGLCLIVAVIAIAFSRNFMNR